MTEGNEDETEIIDQERPCGESCSGYSPSYVGEGKIRDRVKAHMGKGGDLN